MHIRIPALALVVLVGPSGSGKSTFARTHFKPTEVISSDACRGMVSDDENNQAATNDAFELLHFITRKRLSAGLLTVIDATNVQQEARKELLKLAYELHVMAVAVVFNIAEEICQERNQHRPDRDFGPHVVRRQHRDMRRSISFLEREGFRSVTIFDTPEQLNDVTIVRERLWNDRRDLHGPFDLVGDIHGCADELTALLHKLGYQPNPTDEHPHDWHHPAQRMLVFLGDLVDRGPDSPRVLRIAMDMIKQGHALVVPGNHDIKLLRKLRGRDVKIAHGLAETLEQLAVEPASFQSQVIEFLDRLIGHYVLDDGKLVVAHAGLPEAMHGRASGKVREFALYGETTGEIDEFGLPVRWNWAANYRGRAIVVYGHTPTPTAEWLNHTINIDTGCVFGGKLTALRYPERELVSVAAARVYAESSRPLHTATVQLSAQQEQDRSLDLADVIGKRIIETSLHGKITIRAEQATAALEVISRFAIDPRWLIYLPPTMSPSETSQQPDLLEHPAEALAYYRNQGVERVVCEEKHMGSRAVVVLCRDQAAAQRHFGVADQGMGVIYTRTGRRFLTDLAIEQALLERLGEAVERAGIWAELGSEWLLLDCEIMPWSAKAHDLLRQQYAPVGAAARAALGTAMAGMEAASARGIDLGAFGTQIAARAAMVNDYAAAYRRYCWPVEGLHGLRLAPFHLLASDGQVHHQRSHRWHMQLAERLVRADPHEQPLLQHTRMIEVDLADQGSQAAAIDWWLDLTSNGGEGMVVKPIDFVARGVRGLIQPAIKCRGREYLRIIYGPEYSAPANLERLRQRGLGSKRSLALREFALGIEGLERFVAHEPLRRVHECVFAVLALESDPIDPRL
ncbi:MAG: polynucleotide kinase-phosphatase [Roseiflexaceae bacterium]